MGFPIIALSPASLLFSDCICTVSVCVCVCVFTHVYQRTVCVYLCVHVSSGMCVCISVCVCLCKVKPLAVHIKAVMSLNLQREPTLCVCVCVYVCVYMRVWMCVCSCPSDYCVINHQHSFWIFPFLLLKVNGRAHPVEYRKSPNKRPSNVMELSLETWQSVCVWLFCRAFIFLLMLQIKSL